MLYNTALILSENLSENSKLAGSIVSTHYSPSQFTNQNIESHAYLLKQPQEENLRDPIKTNKTTVETSS